MEGSFSCRRPSKSIIVTTIENLLFHSVSLEKSSVALQSGIEELQKVAFGSKSFLGRGCRLSIQFPVSRSLQHDSSFPLHFREDPILPWRATYPLKYQRS